MQVKKLIDCRVIAGSARQGGGNKGVWGLSLQGELSKHDLTPDVAGAIRSGLGGVPLSTHGPRKKGKAINFVKDFLRMSIRTSEPQRSSRKFNTSGFRKNTGRTAR